MTRAFDTHCHLTDPRFAKNLPQILASLGQDGIGPILVPGYDMRSSQGALALAQTNKSIYAAAGVHPHDALLINDKNLDKLKNILTNEKCVAVGEIGLDYHYSDGTPKEIQKKAFEAQLELAAAMNKPVIIHMRDATADTMAILRQHMPHIPRRGVMHCFSGSWETAQEVLDMGLDISFAGPLTYHNFGPLIDVCRRTPLKHIWIETDAPYLTPHPHRGKRNEPKFVRLVAEKVAELHGISMDEVCMITSANARRVLGIP